MSARQWADVAAATHAAINGGKPCAAGCRWPVDPAAAAGPDGTPGVYDTHPGCEQPTSKAGPA